MRWILVLLAAVAATTIVAVRYLPWWGVLAYFGVLVLVVPLAFKLGFALYIRQVGHELASALAGATLAVHAVRAVPPPTPEEMKKFFEDDDPDPDDEPDPDDKDDDPFGELPDDPPDAWNWYELELTITPDPTRPAADSDNGWTPESLLLVPPGTPRGEFSDAAIVARVEWWDKDAYKPTAGRCCYQPERLRLLVGAKPGTGTVEVRYMFFGTVGGPIDLPPPLRA